MSIETAYTVPTMTEVLRARLVLRQYLAETPLVASRDLSTAIEAGDVFVKCENLQPTGAFKLRGGVYLMSQLSPHERSCGVVVASTGNHGQSIAYASRLFAAPCTVFAPESAERIKVQRMQQLGATVHIVGKDYDDARVACEAHAQQTGQRYIHSANEPDLIAGVATETLELLLAVPDLDVLYVPIGAGSGAAGACIVGRALRGSHLYIVGVQSTGAPAVYESWRAGALLELPRKGTIAAGLDSRVAFELPLAILSRNVDAIVLVEDGEIIAGMRLLFETCRQVAEPAGAAAMAAAYKLRQQHQGRKVGIILSGGNVDQDMFRRALTV